MADRALDPTSSDDLDEIVALASTICGTPIALLHDPGATEGTLGPVDRTHALDAAQRATLETLSTLIVQNLALRRAIASERTTLLDAQQRAERELDRIFDLSIDFLGWFGSDGTFRRVNPAFERALGWSAEDLCSRPLIELVHLDDIPATVAQAAALGDGAPPRQFESRFQCKDGTYRWLSWNAVGEGGLNYFVARDVTNEKAARTAHAKLLADSRESQAIAERATRAMDEFLATVSHELRTPLNAMLGWTRLLRSGQLPEAARPTALETIERNASVQAQLIEDLLDVSRIISGTMRLDVVPVELVAVIEAALDVVRPAADAKGIRLHPILDPGASHVTGDSARLLQVIWNLLANAVKFTPKGGRIEIRLSRVASFIDIAVTDTGQGIDPAFLDHVFERFRQADGLTTRTHGGLGLGLAIVKNLVELHGGSVRAESPGPGLGASFVVRLPVSLVRPESIERLIADHPAREVGSLAFQCPPGIEGLKILVVDDERDARELLVTILAQCGAVVTSASSAAEALAAIELGAPDVMVSDVGMPDEDGYELVRRLRLLPAAKGGRLPVVALTAYARAEERTRALRAGFNMHVPKPVEPSELLAVIASLAARSMTA
jgi:PAS domain S-box-containing protein